MSLMDMDARITAFFGRISESLGRFAIFLVYFWFGILKVLGLSPASELVQSLCEKTLPFFSPAEFLIVFGVIECIIGIMFLFPKLSRFAIVVLLLHMVTTIMPLAFLPQYVWTGFMVPTLEGQYIIKNILLISVAIFIAARIQPSKGRVNDK